MPELPDVETFSRYLRRTSGDQRVAKVQVRTPRVLRGVSPTAFARRVMDQHLAHPRRHGKLLFVDLDGGGDHLVLHFGMTGFLRHDREPQQTSPHARITFQLEDGSHLDYDDQRMFGWVGIVDDVEAYLRDADLGPDALQLDAAAFAERLKQKRSALKSALMDQHLMAGIGNVYSDEILFHARLHPRIPTDALDAGDLRRLHQATRHVLERAIEAGADPARMPRSWLLPHRKSGERCPRCGTELERLKVQQRSAWYCPRCQPER